MEAYREADTGEKIIAVPFAITKTVATKNSQFKARRQTWVSQKA